MEIIKDSLIRMSLFISNLRGETYDGARNMLGYKSGVAKQIKEEQPKTFETVKEVTKSSSLINDVMGTVAEITISVKYSPKREQILQSIKEMFEFVDDNEYDTTVTISKLCVTRWTVRATTSMKVLSNYAQLMKLWEICLQETLTREVRSRIIDCQFQMKLFKFFYNVHLSYKLYLITDNLSKSLQKESMSAIKGQKIVQTTLKTLQNMSTDESSDLFYECVLVKASKHQFISKTS